MNIYPLTLFYDSNCPICRFDIDSLQVRNQADLLRFVDITAADFDPSRYGLTLRDFEAEVRAQCADGRMVSGMETVRLACQAAGLSWLVAPSAWGVLRRPADTLYKAFARNRHWLGRHFGWLFDSLVARQVKKRAARQCENGACSINTQGRSEQSCPSETLQSKSPSR